MLTYEFPPFPGSIGRYVYYPAKELMRRGHKVTVISRAPYRRSYYEVYEGIPVYRVFFTYSYPSLFGFHGFLVQRLFRTLEANFDLLHIQASLSPPIRTSLPTVVSFHGTVKKDISRTNIRSLRSFLVKGVLVNQFCAVEKKLVEAADVITTVSTECLNEIKEYYNTRDKRIMVLGNAVESDFFVPPKESVKPEYILYTGRLEPRKGLETLIESARCVCERKPATRFVVVGAGSIEGHLKKMVGQFGLGDNFYFAGYVTKNRLLEYYQGATVYVLPSYYEGLPCSMMEAMSCGVPSISTTIGGVLDLVTDGENGLLVPPRDHEKLAAAILTLLHDQPLRQILSSNAREHVVKNFTWQSLTDRLEEAYQLAISSRSAARKAAIGS